MNHNTPSRFPWLHVILILIALVVLMLFAVRDVRAADNPKCVTINQARDAMLAKHKGQRLWSQQRTRLDTGVMYFYITRQAAGTVMVFHRGCKVSTGSVHWFHIKRVMGAKFWNTFHGVLPKPEIKI